MIPVKPKDCIWTDEQWIAIHDSGKNILVSAGAGSGKTAVLKERVLNKLKNGVSLKNLVILTFTKAAAAEMKERIRKVIGEEVQKGNKDLLSEYEYVDQAHIQNFDSYTLELLKKYHYVLGIDRNVSTVDNAFLNVISNKIINNLFDEYYQSNDDEFNHLIEYFCIKDDKTLKKDIINLNDKLELLTDREEYLEKYQDEFLNAEKLRAFEKEYIDSVNEKIEYIKDVFHKLYEVSDDNEYINNVNDIKDNYKDLFGSVKFEDLRNITLGRKRVKDALDKDLALIINVQKAKCTEIVGKIREMVEMTNTESHINKLLDEKRIVIKLIEIVNKFNERLTQYKYEKNAFSFMDIAKLAIKILKSNDEIRNEIVQSLDEIMVDEYQDTSDIQEELVSLISNNNVYMVGDIKQSIYRFRNANPDIFNHKYIEYKKDDNDNVVIDLSKNFRSREEVLLNINDIFNKIMNMKFGGVNYNEGHELIFGQTKYSKVKDHDSNFEIYTYTKDEKGDLSHGEAEARIIAKDILDKISSNYKVAEEVGKEFKLVNATYKDFCILSPVKTNFDTYKKVFESMGIPLMVHKDQDFMASDDVNSIINLFRLVNEYSKYKRNRAIEEKYDKKVYRNIEVENNIKYSLISALRSFIFRVDDSIINDILISENFLETLKEMLPEIYSKLEYLSEYVENNTIREFADETFTAFDIYGQLNMLYNIDDVENRIDFLLDKCEELSSLGFSLDEYISYFDEVKNICSGNDESKKIKLSASNDTSKNAVKIMTIHNSKGLEFNVCYMCDMQSTFKYKEFSSDIIFDRKYGIMIPVNDDGMQDSFIKKTLKSESVKSEISERLRLFYVALTRAKDKFIIVEPDYQGGCDCSYDEVGRLLYNSLKDVVESLAKPFALNKSQKIIFHSDNFIKPPVNISTKDINYINLNIEKKMITKGHASMSSFNVVKKSDKDKMELGTKIHKFLEVIDFDNYVEDINKLDINDFYKNKLMNFFEKFNDLKMSLNIKVCKLYHEYEFSYIDKENGLDMNGIIDLLVQGVSLDSNKTKYLIVDYKLKDVSKEGYVKQMSTYYNYIKEITSEEVEVYLYSIIDEKFTKIEV